MNATVTRGDVTLHLEDEGSGPAVLFLHGWPDTGALWAEVAPRLRAGGFRTLVPDLRGAGRSSKPEAVAAYGMVELVQDAIAILDQREVERAHVVGHDWGASLAWMVATFAPERVDRLAALSVGHPSAFRGAGLEQKMRSWYMLIFGQPELGAKFLRMEDYAIFRTWLRHPLGDALIEQLERDGQLEAHLRWYQANTPPTAFLDDPPLFAPVAPPTLGVWSTGDVALGEAQMVRSAEFCANGFTYRKIEGVGHWVPLEAPERVADELLAFFVAR